MLGGVRGPPFIACPSQFAAAADKLTGEPSYCTAGRRGGGWLAAGATDERSTVGGGELARCGGLGGAAHGGGGCGRRRAVKKLAGNAAGGEEAVGALGATWRVGKDQDELGEAYPGARWLEREHVQNACSARAPGVHGDCSTKCQDGQNC